MVSGISLTRLLNVIMWVLCASPFYGTPHFNLPAGEGQHSAEGYHGDLMLLSMTTGARMRLYQEHIPITRGKGVVLPRTHPQPRGKD